MTETEIWTKWESQVVNGAFPLRRFLGRSNHSVVFLTECKAHNLTHAAIKILPADPALAETQLARWKSVAAYSHPHLIRLLEAGQCTLGGHPFLFVVTEYAEQNLAQILPHRALTAGEVTELLTPTLEVLAYLHHKGMVHGQLKPPNFLVVNDVLKLSSDAIRAVGEAAISTKSSPYDAPEAVNGAIGPAGDVYGLGVSLTEALTQRLPDATRQASEASLPAALAPVLADFIRRALSRDPTRRPTIADFQARLNPAPPAPAAPAKPVEPIRPVTTAQPVAPAKPTPAAPAAAAAAPSRAVKPFASHWIVPAAAVLLIVSIAVWAALRPFRSPANPHSSAPVASQPASPPPQNPAPGSANPATAATSVQHQEIPFMSRSARDSIHGQIKVAVLVNVDRAGNVLAENIELHGSSRYFARLASDAAKKWKFAPAGNPSVRQWLLQFEFSRSGVSAQATARGKQ